MFGFVALKLVHLLRWTIETVYFYAAVQFAPAVPAAVVDIQVLGSAAGSSLQSESVYRVLF